MKQGNLIKFSGFYSFIGNRPYQEDFSALSRERGVFVVADGFGGPKAGDLASQMACEAIKEFLEKEAGDDDATFPFIYRSYLSVTGNVLFNALAHANKKILNFNKDRQIHERGGASVIACYFKENHLAIANIGTCSGWLFRNGKWVELVIPKSYSKLINPFQLDDFEKFSIPLMALGISKDLEPEIIEYRGQKGDWIVLVSDGLPFEWRELIEPSLGLGNSTKQVEKVVLEEIGKLDLKDNASVLLINL